MKSLRVRNATGNRRGLNELLNYQQLVGDGTILMKDGGLLAGFWFSGQDFESASDADLEELRDSARKAFASLDGSWMLHIECFRRREREYIDGLFTEPTDLVIDEERAESSVFLRSYTGIFVTWLPPRLEQSRAGRGLMHAFSIDEKVIAIGVRAVLEAQLAKFEKQLQTFVDAMSLVGPLQRMRTREDNCELLQSINCIVNGEWRPCRPPPRGMYLDTYLAHALWNPRDHLVMRGKVVSIVTVMGYPEKGTYPGMLMDLSRLGIEYRWSNRLILLDYQGSRAYFGRLSKAWERMQRSFVAQVLRSPLARVNKDAVRRVNELDEAFSHLESRKDKYGHHTCVVELRAETREEASEHAKLVIAAFQRAGFTAYVEELNTMEAWRGSMPGHGRENFRKPGITTENYADVSPLAAEWRGERHSPNPLLPEHSPPLLLGSTSSGDSFYFNWHRDDAAHGLILGPVGSGKSSIGALIASQFGRYPGSQVFVIDSGYSMQSVTLARRDGLHYALAYDGGLKFCPLAGIDTGEGRRWAQDILRTLFEEQGLQLTPRQGEEIDEIVELLAATTTHAADRSLSAFAVKLQDEALRSAMRFYTSGPGALLNGDSDELRTTRFNTFEISRLMELKSPVVVPTLLCLFKEIERRLHVSRPTLLLIDEAWLALGHSRFALRLKQWLETLRKLNCAVVLSTQNVAQIMASPIREAVFSECRTRILLSNRAAQNNVDMRKLYAEQLELSDEAIRLVASARRKREYVVVKEHQVCKLTVHLGPVQRALLANNTGLDRIRELHAEYGYQFVPHWLAECGLDKAAARWRALDRLRSTSEAA